MDANIVDDGTAGSTPRTLLDHHRRELHASGLTDATIDAAGIYSETCYAKLAAKLRWKKWFPKMGPAIIFPFLEPDGSPTGCEKLKPDNPRRNRSDGKPIKYEWRRGEPLRVYYPPGIGKSLATGCDLVVTEGEKKALCGTQHGFPTIGLPGVFGFSVRGKATLPPGMDEINWNRIVYIAFDSDIVDKPQVQQAANRLAATLTRRGATVLIARIPGGDDGEKVGLDDYLVANGSAKFQSVLKDAEPPDEEDAVAAKDIASNIDPVPEACRLLEKHGRDEQGRRTLLYHREQYYQYRGNRYVERSKDDIKTAIVKWLHDSYFMLKGEHVNNVLMGVNSESHLDSSHDLNSWIGSIDGPSCPLALENGILDVDSGTLIPHSPDWFSTVCLPYAFDPAATCPTWEAAVARALDYDAERIAILQEFYGVCLTPSTDYQKALILHGDGGTGKSSLLAGLMATIGSDNYSSVPLEMFNKEYSLWSTIGKLANIVPDASEIEAAAEGVLKILVSGDPHHFNRKYKHPVETVPTAKLVLATNVLPRFRDRTSGIWRRLIVLPVDRVIPSDERIPGMDKAKWWREQGELPGMLNWSLAGLRRLREQGRFTRSAVVEAAVAEYREESNPAAMFLRERYREHPNGRETAASVYEGYREWCDHGGFRCLHVRHFGREVSRVFPGVKSQPVFGGGRVYLGLTRGGEFGECFAEGMDSHPV